MVYAIRFAQVTAQTTQWVKSPKKQSVGVYFVELTKNALLQLVFFGDFAYRLSI